MTFPSIMGRKSQMRLDVLMSPGSTIEVRTYKDAFPILGEVDTCLAELRGSTTSRSGITSLKTRWNINHRKVSYFHISTSTWVPCAFRNDLSYGARFCVLQGKKKQSSHLPWRKNKLVNECGWIKND